MSTPLDRLKEAFPGASCWTLYDECPFRGQAYGYKACALYPSGLSISGPYCDSEAEAIDACIAKAREVGINSDAEAHADRLAETLRYVLHVWNSEPLPMDIVARCTNALAAHEERRAKPEHRSDARRGKA